MQAQAERAGEVQQEILKLEGELSKIQDEMSKLQFSSYGAGNSPWDALLDMIAGPSSDDRRWQQLFQNRDKLEKGLSELTAEFDRLIGVTDDSADSAEGAGSAFDGASDKVEKYKKNLADYTEALSAASKQTSQLAKDASTLSNAFAEQEASGRLSVETILQMTDAGYAAALSIDAETGAVRLNADAYLELAKARIVEQTVALKAQRSEILSGLSAEHQAITDLTESTYGFAEAKIAEAKARLAAKKIIETNSNGEIRSIDAQIAALEELSRSLDKVVSGNYSSKKSSSSKTSAASAAKQTDPAEERRKAELEAFKKEQADKKYLLDMGKLDEEQYYNELRTLQQKYLQNNLEEYRRVDVEIKKHQDKRNAEALAAQEKSNKEALDAQEKTTKEALEAQERAAKETEEHIAAEAEALRTLRAQKLADLKYSHDIGLATDAEYYAALERHRDKYFEEDSAEWRSFTLEIERYKQDAAQKARDQEFADLDYRHSRGTLTEKEYFDALEQLRDQYFEADSAEWRDHTLRIEQGRKQIRDEAIAQELDDLTYSRDMGSLSDPEYYAELERYRDRYFETDSAEWRKYTLELKRYADSARDAELRAQEDFLKQQESDREARIDQELADLRYRHNMGVLSEKEYYAALERLRDAYFEVDSQEWREHTLEIERYRREAAQKAIDQELSDLDYYHSMGILSDPEYYTQLERYRDRYFAVDSEEWRKYTLELKRYADKVRDEEIRAYEDYLKELETQRKNWLEERRKEIEAELKLEEERLRGLISNIDEEIAARRRLREDENQDDAVARAQKRLAAAQHELAFARDEESRTEAEKEVVRAQQELDKALLAKEDTAFYRQKEEEKEKLQQQMEDTKVTAEQKKTEAEAQSETLFLPAHPNTAHDAASLQQQAEGIARIVGLSVVEATRIVQQYMNNQTYTTAANVQQTNNFYSGGVPTSMWQMEQMIEAVLRRV